MTGQAITNDALKIMINRTFKSSPDYTEPSLFKVGTGTTNPTIIDTDLENEVIISGSDTIKSFLTGYPTIDETNLQVKFRGVLNTLEANGNNLTEFGIFNNDTTKKLFSRSVFNPINKTSAVEISFVEVEKF